MMGPNQSTVQEVAIIGGSAVGFFVAQLLARRGVRVQVFEKADRLDPTRRTLIVTSRMRDLLGQLCDGSVVNEIRHFELFSDGRAAKISLQRPDLVVERARLIRSLAERAQADGTQVSLRRKFVSLEGNSKGVQLVFERSEGGGTEELQVEAVIGADGATSEVAKVAGWPVQTTVPVLQAVVRLPADMPQDTTRVWFLPEDTPYFYWLIPESATQGVLGLIGEDGQAARRCLDRFIGRLGLAPTEIQGARIPLYTQWVPFRRKVGGGHVYLVGDASGQVKVTTVGGLVTGFRGALGVSEVILNGGRSRELRTLRRELDFHLLIRKVLHRFTQADYSSLLDLLNVSTRRLLGVNTRDEVGKLLWQLSLSQPRFLLLGLRALLTGSSRSRRFRV